jgi:uncharacterized protein YacL (UPF0231 family)
MNLSQIILKRKTPRLILSNGSERGDFISLDHIYTKLDRIHDGIQVMKTYYPYEECWSVSKKVSEITAKNGVSYAWDYEYEDYHPFNIWSTDSNTLSEFQQIKSYGSDIHLTLTIDLGLNDEDIALIAESLKSFGSVFIRINHEANGNWFRYNQQHTYKEINDFFVKCHKIIKNVSSKIFTVFSVSADVFMEDRIVRADRLHLSKDEMAEALQIADYWAIDKYTSLNWGWPFEQTITSESKTYFKGDIDEWWRIIEECYLKMIWLNDRVAKPLFISEFNSDSDVDGYEGQAETIYRVYSKIADGEYDWLAGIVLYQYRDFGGLGLEKGCNCEFQTLPSLNKYKESVNKFKYSVETSEQEWHKKDFTFTWENTDFIRGLSIGNVCGKTFRNTFDIPVFIMSGDQQRWQRINTGYYLEIECSNSVNLFIPPFLKNGIFRSSNIVYEVKEKLLGMIE